MKRPRRPTRAADDFQLPGWDRLRHGGLLFDAARAAELAKFVPKEPLTGLVESRFRRLADALGDSKDTAAASRFVNYTLDEVCGFARSGGWTRGNEVPAEEGRRALTGELAKPRSLWTGRNGARLPVFFDRGQRLGVGKGRREMSRVVEWLRNGGEHLALLTNGREWRLVFAGLDYEAWCEWTVESFFEEGGLAPQVETLRALLSPPPWTPETEGKDAPLLRAIRDTRKGQAAVSEELGERVREAVEILIRSHGEPLKQIAGETDPADIYRAACRVAMRMVVVLYAESRDLLPRDNALYDAAYGLTALRDRLQRHEAAGRPLSDRTAAWPRLLALFRLVHDGCSHSELPVTRYGGELFAPGVPDAEEGVSRALSVFESACFDSETVSDLQVNEMLRRLTRTRIPVRQGRKRTSVAAPVDFSDLSSEYIGVLYEGLLDYELKTAAEDDPVVFVPEGNTPALPLSSLEGMDDGELKALFEKLRKSGTAKDEADEAEGSIEKDAAEEGEPDALEEVDAGADGAAEESGADDPVEYRERARRWAFRAVEAAGLVEEPSEDLTPEERLAHDGKIACAAERLVARLAPPGEWYLVRWGGTRKGSGSFYTRPGLAVPTVQRTLRPLAFDPPKGTDGEPDRFAPVPEWTPKKPEDILRITVCDPACGSGTFPLAALRFLTDALYDSLRFHQRIEPKGEASLVRLLGLSDGSSDRATEELIPTPPDADDFEPRLKAVLRRYVVERCIYAVDLDPLAVELCRLSLWIETMDRELAFGFFDHKIKCGNALIGAWFDTFRHYPVMAWKRRGGDEEHGNGKHFEKNARGRAIKTFVKERLTPDLVEFLKGPTLFRPDDLLSQASVTHDETQAALEALHALPVKDPAETARRYRKEILNSPGWLLLKEAMDLWCACWFWPVEERDLAPLPTTFAAPSAETQEVVRRITATARFFHWELEFPDVFRGEDSGFDAILGNPPWDIAKPNSDEFFSNVDPLYLTYRPQETRSKQKGYFVDDKALERRWLDYRARFRSQTNFVACAASPFGDPEADLSKKPFTISRGHGNAKHHARWREERADHVAYADRRHPFRHQGSADLNAYKLFLETAHALLRPGGRLGFLVPSNLCSDKGAKDLRDLFLEQCRWEWLFGFENRRKIFPIDSRFKFNPVVMEKGRTTEAVRTAFMRHDPDDWERADDLRGTTLDYRREVVARLSPRHHAFVELPSNRRFRTLEKIYEGAVAISAEGADAWDIRYETEFHMTNHSALFSPRAEMEEEGYRPDEYSRWLRGDWRLIEELWEHSNGLSPEDVVRGGQGLHLAEPPDDRPARSRANIRGGIVLSREGDAWIREDDIEETALPFYQGIMIQPFTPSARGWLSGTGLRAKWDYTDIGELRWNPQFLMDADTARSRVPPYPKIGYRRIARSTDYRSFIGAVCPPFPCGDSVFLLHVGEGDTEEVASVACQVNSLVFDFVVRSRVGGTNLSWYLIEECPLIPKSRMPDLLDLVARLNLFPHAFAPHTVDLSRRSPAALLPAERLRLRAALDAVVAALYGCEWDDLLYILTDCDWPSPAGEDLDVRGFWRVDRDQPPELRHTVLTLVAFRDLQQKIEAAGGDANQGIAAFLSQNHGEGWMLPKTLRLADYCLGHDDRAKEHQPVAGRLGPRFYDSQLAQTPEERERETHLHARNLLGAEAYGERLAARIAKTAPVNDEGGDLDPLIRTLASRLEDDYTRRLLGDEGVAALVAELCPRAVPQRTQWLTFLQLLHSAGHLAPADCLRVLDRLLTRDLITDPEHHRWSALGREPQDPSADLLAAEPKHEFQLHSQQDPRKLFDD